VALRAIAEALRGAGVLGPEQEIVLALHTIEERLTVPEMVTLVENMRQALLGYVTEQGLPVEVIVVEVTAELVDVAQAIGLLPAEYVDFLAVGYPLAKEALKLQKELGIDPVLFKEELSTIGEVLVDMREAGIESQVDALAILKRSLAADPKLEELTTITDALIDLTEKGLSKEEALAKIQAAVKTDPTLQKFDDLIEIPEKEDIKEVEKDADAKPVKPERKVPGADNPKVDAVKKEAEKDAAKNGKDDKPDADKPDTDAPDKETEEKTVEEPVAPMPGAPEAPPNGRNRER